MLRRSSKDKKLVDRVFVMAQKAKDAAEKFGKDKVINATIGSLYGEDEKLAVLECVAEAHKNQLPEDFAAYASSFTGSAEYKESVKISVLGDNYKETFKDHFVSVIASPGGTGAISNTIRNYVNEGDTILIPEWLWGPYKMMARENQSKSLTYKLFADNMKFNLEDVKSKVDQLANEQENILLILNDPCQNPTGYKLSFNEWKALLSFLNEKAKTNNIILINDIAYTEYDNKSEDEKEQFRSLFKNNNKNLLVVFTFSLSKALTIYGMRVGAQIALSSDKKTIEEFDVACSYTCRATWSNVSKGGMKIFSDIMLDPQRRERIIKERQFYSQLLKERADIFISEAKEVGLEILPYRSGFFLAIPTREYTDKVGEILTKKNIFTVILENGIRIALCSVPKKKLVGLAKKIKESIDEAKK